MEMRWVASPLQIVFLVNNRFHSKHLSLPSSAGIKGNCYSLDALWYCLSVLDFLLAESRLVIIMKGL
ncbi:unnamed protein product [Cuscuta campestris]|uniref:Uncharacterized protein n=1 Tax=Cuscuta campestris TaxID=132261 RepID=A0A484LFC3_9ASTE|nr:unnamed protein product [Cuscuta campestris]